MVTESEVLKSSVCQESHLFQPLRSGESGALTEQTQSLTFVKSAPITTSQEDGNNLQLKTYLISVHLCTSFTEKNGRSKNSPKAMHSGKVMQVIY